MPQRAIQLCRPEARCPWGAGEGRNTREEGGGPPRAAAVKALHAISQLAALTPPSRPSGSPEGDENAPPPRAPVQVSPQQLDVRPLQKRPQQQPLSRNPAFPSETPPGELARPGADAAAGTERRTPLQQRQQPGAAPAEHAASRSGAGVVTSAAPPEHAARGPRG